MQSAAKDRAVILFVGAYLGRRTRRRAILAAIIMAATVSGCVWAPFAGKLSESEKLQQQAQAALARWADAVASAGGHQGVVVVGDLTDQVGDWEPAVGDNNKLALMAGLVQAAASLPPAPDGEGNVTWQDGTTQMVPVMSAQQAVAAITADIASKEVPCPDCVPLRISGARLTSAQVTTTRGSAIAPVWEFTLGGTAVKVTRVAIVDPITIALAPWTEPPWGNSGDAPAGISIDSATATVDRRELTVAFVGVPLAGDQACGADYTADAVESPLAVVVIVTVHPNGAGGACDLVGAARTASVTLAAPLGDRTVLEVTQGRPVPALVTP
jgi:hypothetical protein